ncbi:MAG: hypothetical protein ABI945_06645, partial [Nitrospirales bacterium]
GLTQVHSARREKDGVSWDVSFLREQESTMPPCTSIDGAPEKRTQQVILTSFAKCLLPIILVLERRSVTPLCKDESGLFNRFLRPARVVIHVYAR